MRLNGTPKALLMFLTLVFVVASVPRGLSFHTGQAADVVIGQTDFVSKIAAATATGLDLPARVMFDNFGNLWVADSDNSRILEYSRPFSNGMSASIVIGQPDFTSHLPTTTASGLWTPGGIAFDVSGNLWVADSGNNRVLLFLTPFSSGMSASIVIGQPSFTTRNFAPPTATDLNGPGAVAVDSSNHLWVADWDDLRALEYTPPFANDMSASLVVGQPDFTSQTPATTSAGLGDPSHIFGSPGNIAFDSSGDLWLPDPGNSRVLEYVPPFSTGMSATVVLGQSSFTAGGSATTATGMRNAYGATFDPLHNLWIADSFNNRTLEYVPPFSNGMSASLVIGQSSFTAGGPATSATGLSHPIGVQSDIFGDLWITDTNNNRVLEYFSSDYDSSIGSWYPAGAQMQTLSISVFTTEGSEFNSLLAGQVDFQDVPITDSQTSSCHTAMIVCSFVGAPNIHARLPGWPLGGSSPGTIDAIGDSYEPQSNYFNWVNAYSPSPSVANTIRWGFAVRPTSLNPFQGNSSAWPWNHYIMSNIYDQLLYDNPLCSPTTFTGTGINACSSNYQMIDWMTTSHSFLCYPNGPACTSTTLGYGNATYFSNTVADLRLSLNRSNHWQESGPVTAWDVKYTFTNLLATGAFQASSLSNIDHINVLDEFTLDLNLKAKLPLTELLIGSVTIIPGHIWSTCDAFTWNSGVTGSNLVSSNIRNAAEDACVGTFTAPSIITVNGIRADAPAFDVVNNGFLIGSGPYTCQSTGGSGHPPVGTIGGGCSVDNTQSPAPTLGAYTLTRTGCSITASGTTCGIASASGDYFHSSAALAKYIWAGVIGSGSADFSKVLTINSCHSSTPSANCPHWAQGIGNPGGTGTNPVGLSQRLAVNSLKATSWIGFSTEMTTGTQLILTCKAGYTLPGTTLTPCTAANAGWSGTVLPGIGGYAVTLYEVGSNVLSTSTSTLAPASIVGCSSPIGTDASAYPNAGYDC